MMRVSGAPSMRMKQRHAGSKRGTARAGQLTDSSTRVKFVKRVTSWRQVLQTARGSGLRADVRQRLLAYAPLSLCCHILGERQRRKRHPTPGVAMHTAWMIRSLARFVSLRGTNCSPPNVSRKTKPRLRLPFHHLEPILPRLGQVRYRFLHQLTPRLIQRLACASTGPRSAFIVELGRTSVGIWLPGLYAILRLLHLLCHRSVSAPLRKLLQERTHV